jgi:hypothetical protein
MIRSPRVLLALFSLVAVGAGCPGADPEASLTATDTGATTTGPTTAAPTTTGTGVDTETTGGFLMCKEPEAKANVDFDFDLGTLPDDGEVDVACQLTGGSSGGAFSASVELDCLDDEGNSHPVKLGLQLYNDPKLAVLGVIQVRLRTAPVYTFGGNDEMLTLRGENDELLVFAARGHDGLVPALAPFWAPLVFTPAEPGLCEKFGDCDEFQRTALDITFAGVTERVFDRDWVQFKGTAVAAHVGSANIADYASETCLAGDAPMGLEATVIVVAEAQ